jgi:uncharacterized protein YqhQ
MSETKQFSMGGQAVLEGVMMNGIHHYAVSVRKSNGEIVSQIVDHSSLTEKKPIYNLPIIRGCIRFVESLKMGMKVLDYSASMYAEEEETEEETVGGWKGFLNKALDVLAMVIGVVLAVGLFVVLPVYITKWLMPNVTASWLVSLVEGLIRLTLFLVYLWLMSKVKDIRRTFEYHGAEHKAVACYEAGKALTVENARHYSRFNKRCGTSFIFIIMLFGILVCMFLPVSRPLVRIAYRLLLIPLIAGLSYELLKFSARSESPIVNALVAPGLLFQRLTTKEPDDEELEVALTSAIRILEAEGLELPQ